MGNSGCYLQYKVVGGWRELFYFFRKTIRPGAKESAQGVESRVALWARGWSERGWEFRFWVGKEKYACISNSEKLKLFAFQNLLFF